MARACCKYFTVSLVPVAALLLAILFAFGILSLPIIYTELGKKYEYGMVIDAGSSHTTIYLYKLRVGPIMGEVEEIDKHKVGSSLDRIALQNHSNFTAEIEQVVEQLLNHSNQSLRSIDIPTRLYNTSRVYLGATAGMRLLRRNDTVASNKTMKAAKKAMERSGFKAKSSIIISGKEEAASGWLTANTLVKDKSERGHIGSLDLGGGSAEIAFSVSGNSTSPFHVVERLMNDTRRLYARSYLCYGHNEALGRFLAHQINKTTTTQSPENYTNPCLSANVTVSHTHSDVYTYCASGPSAQEVFGSTFSAPVKQSESYKFVGTGDLKQCLEDIQELFNFTSCEIPENCVNGTFQAPPVNGTVVGFSGFNYIARELGLGNETFDHTRTILETFNTTCAKMNSNAKIINDSCFSGLFIAHMMEVGFGMNNASQNWTLVFKDHDKDKKISFGWALGYFMNKTYEFPEKPYHDEWPYSAVDMVIGMVILTILCAIFVVFFFLTFYACKKALKGHDGYQSIS